MCISKIRVQKNALRPDTSEPIIKLGYNFGTQIFTI